MHEAMKGKFVICPKGTVVQPISNQALCITPTDQVGSHNILCTDILDWSSGSRSCLRYRHEPFVITITEFSQHKTVDRTALAVLAL